jgi:hypothetical protein
LDTIIYYFKRLKDIGFKLIIGSLYKFTSSLEIKIKKFNYILDETIDKSIVEVTMPPIQIAIKKDGLGDYKKLHIIGNSHAHTFTGSDLGRYALGNKQKEFWDSYSLGPMSAIDLNTSKYNLLTKLFDKYEFKKNDFILIPLGEAECRWYCLREKVLSQHPTNKELEFLLLPFAEAAFSIFLKLIDRGFRPIVWGGHASSRLGPREDKDIPILGESELRNRLSIAWESKMREFARDTNLQFISILPIMLDDNLKTRENFLVDACHLKTDLLEGFLLSEFRNKNIDLSL